MTEPAPVRERRFFGVIEVDSGTIVVGDPAYLLPSREQGKAGVDYQAVIDSEGQGVPIGGQPVVLVTVMDDAPYPVYGEYEDGELVRVCVDIEPIEIPEEDLE